MQTSTCKSLSTSESEQRFSIDLHADAVSLVKSDGVSARLERQQAAGKPTLMLEYEFKGAGHALIRLPVAISLPENFVFRFQVKGQSPANTLEFKMVDPSGENVWWVHRPSFPFARRWQILVNKKRHFTYAWGPVNKPLSEVGFIELTVSATAGGKGRLYFSALEFEALQAVSAAPKKAVVKVSSRKTFAYSVNTTYRADADSGDETANYGWQSSVCDRQYVRVDFGQMREFDGLVVDFGDNYATDYLVQIPQGKSGWRTIDTVSGGTRKRQYHALPESEARSLRLVLQRPANIGKGYHLLGIVPRPIGFASTMSQFFASVVAEEAALAARSSNAQPTAGLTPRYFQKEQSFWTVVGVSGGREKAVINEEGMIEPSLQAPSLEPFIFTDGRLLTWADGKHSQALVEESLPMPVVRRVHEEQKLVLTVETFAQGPLEAPDRASLYARYAVKNTGDTVREGSLFLALRHYQVNPPWQFLNSPGGFTPVRKLSLSTASGIIVVNDDQCIFPLSKPDRLGASRFCARDIVEHMALGAIPGVDCVSPDGLVEVEDARGFCSGALEYRFKLAPGQEANFALVIPYDRTMSSLKPYSWARCQAIMGWHKTLRPVNIDLPAYPELVDTIKSQLGYILVNRDGKALQPGSRCYRRTWIRDGSLTSEALLQLGLKDEVRDFIDWFAPFQYADGKVPCCVDKRGADPTPEHDSHGEFIYLVVEYYRYSKNRELLERLFPRIKMAVGYIDGLRQQRRTDFYRQAENAHLFGLLPESISHEGYSAKPAHSYWDDLFALKGLEDALYAAREIGDEAAAREIGTIYSEFRHDLVASMKAAMAKWQIAYIPGAADRGDFDATSTTIALDPADLSGELADELSATFEAYWQFFKRRRDGQQDWVDYTPYEWRAVGTMVKLGQIERAHEAIAFFMKDRRPHGWNHWAEVVFKDPLTPRFIGDAPHGWVGSDFLRAVRTLFAFEQNGALVVGAGLSYDWLKEGLRVSNMASEYGQLSYSVEKTEDGRSLTYRLSGELSAPVHLRVPVAANDAARRTIVVEQLPAVVSVPL